MKKTTKFLSSLLACLMVLSAASVFVHANDEEEVTVVIETNNYDDIVLSDYVTTDDKAHKTAWKNSTGPSSDFRKSQLYPMIYDDNQSGNWGTSTVMYVFPVDCTNAFPEHGQALNPYAQTDYVVAHNRDQENEFGVEIYEFEMAYKNSASSFFGVLNGTRTSKKKLDTFNIRVADDGKWHKVRLEYDTVNDTAQLFIDEEASNVIEGVDSYVGMSWWIGSGPRYDHVGDPNVKEAGDGSGQYWVLMDNYKFSIRSAPFLISNLAAAKDDGAPIEPGITAETGDSIDITANIVNAVYEDRACTIIYAYYNDDMLVAMNSKEFDIDETKYVNNLEWTDTVPGGIEYDTVRVFVWDTIDGMEALADCKVYSE